MYRRRNYYGRRYGRRYYSRYYPKTQTRNAILPTPCRLPSDPPQIRLTQPRSYTIADRTTLADGAGTYTYSNLINQIRSQAFAGSTDIVFQFQVVRYAVWGPPGPETISMQDEDSRQELEDIGSFSRRPKCCFMVAGAAQTIEDTGSAGPLFNIKSSLATAVLDVRVNVRVWTVSEN